MILSSNCFEFKEEMAGDASFYTIVFFAGLQLSIAHAYKPCVANSDCSGCNLKILIYKLWLETFLKDNYQKFENYFCLLYLTKYI